MNLLSKILGRGSNEYVYLREAFEGHHHQVEEELQNRHPHAVPSLALHGVDLKTVRKRAASVVAATAIAGLLLVRPHAVGAPISDLKQEQEHTQTVSSQEKPSSVQTTSARKSLSAKVVKNIKSDSDFSTDSNKPERNKGHRGHTRGRSYLAPPKEHGLHDLGLHKGDKNAPHPIKSKGDKV